MAEWGVADGTGELQMAQASTYQVRVGGAKPLPAMPLPKVPAGEKHLDATLLAIVRRRKTVHGVLPGVPFN